MFDEDGQYDLVFIGGMIDIVLWEQVDFVYVVLSNCFLYGFVCNMVLKSLKKFLEFFFGGGQVLQFNSYWFILGEIVWSVVVYVGIGVYFDVVFSWVFVKMVILFVLFCDEGECIFGYFY